MKDKEVENVPLQQAGGTTATGRKDSTNRVKVDVTVLQGELLQFLQCQVGGRLHGLQVLLAVGRS